MQAQVCSAVMPACPFSAQSSCFPTITSQICHPADRQAMNNLYEYSSVVSLMLHRWFLFTLPELSPIVPDISPRAEKRMVGSCLG